MRLALDEAGRQARVRELLLQVLLESSYLRLIDSCITLLKAQGPSRTCNECKEEEEEEEVLLEKSEWRVSTGLPRSYCSGSTALYRADVSWNTSSELSEAHRPRTLQQAYMALPWGHGSLCARYPCMIHY